MFGLTCLLDRLLEKPGGSGMLDAALEGRGIGELSATAHCGGWWSEGHKGRAMEHM